jgi:hypothetical protein
LLQLGVCGLDGLPSNIRKFTNWMNSKDPTTYQPYSTDQWPDPTGYLTFASFIRAAAESIVSNNTICEVILLHFLKKDINFRPLLPHHGDTP